MPVRALDNGARFGQSAALASASVRGRRTQRRTRSATSRPATCLCS